MVFWWGFFLGGGLSLSILMTPTYASVSRFCTQDDMLWRLLAISYQARFTINGRFNELSLLFDQAQIQGGSKGRAAPPVWVQKCAHARARACVCVCVSENA